MNAYVLGSTMLIPIVLGLSCFVIRSHVFRAFAVILNAILLTACAAFLLSRGSFEVTLPEFWSKGILALDFLILLYFLYIGISREQIAVVALSLLQLLPLGYLEFVKANGAVVSPTLVVDRLSIIMCLVISIVGSLVCIYALRYMQEHEHHLKLTKSRQPVFFTWLVLFLGAMNGLVFANNIFWLYFFWEVTTLCCYQLIRHDQNEESKTNAMRALWMNLIGGVAFIFAIWLAFDWANTLSVKELVHRGATPVLMVPLALICLAGFTKSAQMPFHTWLLGAMVAPTPVSALLHSSTMVKAGVYIILRFAPGFQGTPLSTMVMLVGAFTFFATAILGLTQSNAKRLLAYSTIGNLGLIVMCAGINTPLAMTAALVLLVFHAVSKGLLFMCVGAIESAIHSRDIEKMSELVTRMPFITTVTVVGIVTMFLAPFGLVVGKWATIEGAMSSPSHFGVIAAIMLVLGSAATTVFWTKYMGRLLNRPSARPKDSTEVTNLSYGVPLVALAFLAIILSALVVPFHDYVVQPAVMAEYGNSMMTTTWTIVTPVGAFAILPLFIAGGIILIMPLLALRPRKEDTVNAYMCGENSDVERCDFCTVGDKYEPLQTGGQYFSDMASEGTLEKWFTPVAVIIVLMLFGLVLRCVPM
jgi:ech hydrogenase subunit A